MLRENIDLYLNIFECLRKNNKDLKKRTKLSVLIHAFFQYFYTLQYTLIFFYLKL